MWVSRWVCESWQECKTYSVENNLHPRCPIYNISEGELIQKTMNIFLNFQQHYEIENIKIWQLFHWDDRILLVISFTLPQSKDYVFFFIDYSLIYDHNYLFFVCFLSNKGKGKKIGEQIMLTLFRPTKPSDPKYFDCFYKHLCFLHFNDDISNYFRITDFNDFK